MGFNISVDVGQKIFEVRVLVNGIERMFQYAAKSPEQAEVKAKKRGQVLSIRKVGGKKSIADWFSGIELMKLVQKPRGLYLGAGVYENDIDLDRILGLKGKRQRRLEENKKDKEKPS